MSDQPLSRDLALRMMAGPQQFHGEWLAGKTVVPVPLRDGLDPAFAGRLAAAGQAMGVGRLLVFRTRSEHIYEPAEVVPARADAFTSRAPTLGGTDYVVTLRDTSGAVLVTGAGFAVVAGPLPFVQAVVGPDVDAAAWQFADHAAHSGSPVLARVAEHLIPPETAGPASTARAPRADLAERVSTWAARFRARRVGTTRWLRFARNLWGWLALALVVSALVLVPSTRGAGVALVGVGYLLWQLFVLCRSRTLTFAGYLRFVVLGALVAVGIATLEQAIALGLGVGVAHSLILVYVAAPLEELLKLLPLLVLPLVARHRMRRFAGVDFLLVAAASGAGFALVEDAVRRITTGVSPASGSVSYTHYALLTWLPGWSDVDDVRFAGHAVTTALVGAAIGLAVLARRRHGRIVWLLPLAALGLAVLDHMAYNNVIAFGPGIEPERGGKLPPPVLLAHVLLGEGHATRWLVLALLVAAVAADYHVMSRVEHLAAPLPGTARLLSLERGAWGLAIRIRSVLPHDAAHVFHRLAAALATAVIAMGQAATRAAHELSVQLAAAQRDPALLFGTLRFVRLRREQAIGLARAGHRPRRDVPPTTEMRDVSAGLASGLVGFTSAAGVAALACAVLPVGAAGAGGPHGALYLAGLGPAFESWWYGMGWTGQVIVAPAALGAFTLLWGIWALPEVRLGVPAGGAVAVGGLPGQGFSSFLRKPREATLGFFRALTPAQLVYYLLAQGLALTLPAGVRRLLGTGDAAGRGRRLGVEDLSAAQQRAYQRYLRQLPPRVAEPRIVRLDRGVVELSARLPAPDRPGCYAEYTKVVSVAGHTVRYRKAIVAPGGRVNYVEEKFTGDGERTESGSAA